KRLLKKRRRMANFNPNQPRDEDGKWTDNGASLSKEGEREFSLFSTYSQRWLGGIDADARATAFYIAKSNKELHTYLLQQSYGADVPKVAALFRVGGFEYYEDSQIVSLFSTLQ